MKPVSMTDARRDIRNAYLTGTITREDAWRKLDLLERDPTKNRVYLDDWDNLKALLERET